MLDRWLYKGKILIVLCLSFSLSSVYAATWGIVEIQNRKIKVEVVTSPQEQRLGLGKRDSLPQNQGMLFIYPNAGQRIFWMKGMRFPIDIIWIHNNIIQHIEANTPPPKSLLVRDAQLPTYGHGILADMILEVPAGYANSHSIQVGNTVRLLP